MLTLSNSDSAHASLFRSDRMFGPSRRIARRYGVSRNFCRTAGLSIRGTSDLFITAADNQANNRGGGSHRSTSAAMLWNINYNVIKCFGRTACLRCNQTLWWFCLMLLHSAIYSESRKNNILPWTSSCDPECMEACRRAQPGPCAGVLIWQRLPDSPAALAELSHWAHAALSSFLGRPFKVMEHTARVGPVKRGGREASAAAQSVWGGMDLLSRWGGYFLSIAVSHSISWFITGFIYVASLATPLCYRLHLDTQKTSFINLLNDFLHLLPLPFSYWLVFI